MIIFAKWIWKMYTDVLAFINQIFISLECWGGCRRYLFLWYKITIRCFKIIKYLSTSFKRSEILGSNGQSPLLCESVIKPLSYVNFVAFINDILASSGCGEKLTGHSFRRGGATFAFHVGLPSENIQDIGMWKSDAYLRYIEKGLPSKSKALQKFGEALPQFTM